MTTARGDAGPLHDALVDRLADREQTHHRALVVVEPGQAQLHQLAQPRPDPDLALPAPEAVRGFEGPDADRLGDDLAEVERVPAGGVPQASNRRRLDLTAEHVAQEPVDGGDADGWRSSRSAIPSRHSAVIASSTGSPVRTATRNATPSVIAR